MESEWGAYDLIAERYDRVWSERFGAAAQRLCSMVSAGSGDSLLDIGTGTGMVPRALGAFHGVAVGCDRSLGMLKHARDAAPGLLVLGADATALPFRDESFSIATSSFVLSHIAAYRRALAEAHRVLKRNGVLCVSNWLPFSNPYVLAWNDCLAAAISREEVNGALSVVAPCETYFSEAGNLEAALATAGFSGIRSERIDLESEMTVERFIDDRELSSTGRLGIYRLGKQGWAQFRKTTKEELSSRFGNSFRYRSSAIIAVGRKD